MAAIIRFIFTGLLLLLITLPSKAQVGVKDSVLKAGLVNIGYGLYLPGGDLADRFGFNQGAGVGVLIKNRKNWMIGFSSNILFGNQVREDTILQGLATESGTIIGGDGELYRPVLGMSGFNVQFHLGKLTRLLQANPNSGVFILGGLGFLQHKINITIDEEVVWSLSKDYQKGYDRLSNGVMLSQFIGYLYSGDKKFINFHVGFEFIQAFTENRRSYNIDQRSVPEGLQTDLFYGFRLGWTLPVYEKPKQRFYYY